MCTTTPSTERPFRPYDAYLDKGCEVNPVRLGCLSCPLPFCKYDDPGAYRNWRDRKHRARVIAGMKAEGLNIPQAAQEFGLTERTIYRYKAKAKEERP